MGHNTFLTMFGKLLETASEGFIWMNRIEWCDIQSMCWCHMLLDGRYSHICKMCAFQCSLEIEKQKEVHRRQIREVGWMFENSNDVPFEKLRTQIAVCKRVVGICSAYLRERCMSLLCRLSDFVINTFLLCTVAWSSHLLWLQQSNLFQFSVFGTIWRISTFLAILMRLRVF